MEAGRTVEVPPSSTTLGPGTAVPGVHADTAHRCEVDHQTTLGDGLAGDVVATTAHGALQLTPLGEQDGLADVGRSVAAGDEGRTAVDEPVVDPPCLLVGEGARLEKIP